MVKDALSLSKQEAIFFKKILPATVGILFLGTPHHGSKAASLGKIAFELSRILLNDPNVKVLRALENNSKILERVSRGFGYVLASGHVKVHSFREEFVSKGMAVVDASSSRIGYLHESCSSLHANHRYMAKFKSTDDVNFQRVVAILKCWVEDCDPTKLLLESSFSVPSIKEVLDSVVYDEAYNVCLDTLNVPETRVHLQNVQPAHANTYNWLFDDYLGFRKWLEGSTLKPIYWISGKPRSGKSTLMKFAMTHYRTQKYLKTCNSHPCLVTGYFFHDRGSKIQKSIEGFLIEILYHVLRLSRELFPLVEPIYQGMSEEITSHDKQQKWKIQKLRQALVAIFSRAKSPLNCCLFVDALDEHEGNHRELISVLMQLAKLPCKNTALQLRLCLAGRSENVFKDAFGMSHGFALLDYTTADIRHYAEDRLQRERYDSADEQSNKDSDKLIDEILRKADGVFLWVRLVIDEMVEGLCEGDTFEELEASLSEIPDELSNLYARALRRTSRISSTARAKQKVESYFMFRIVNDAIEPVPLRHLTKAAHFLSTGKSLQRSMSHRALIR